MRRIIAIVFAAAAVAAAAGAPIAQAVGNTDCPPGVKQCPRHR
jgi:hypothetical protein